VVTEHVQVPVIGEASRVKLYRVRVPSIRKVEKPESDYQVLLMNSLAMDVRYYLTCAQAHAEHPGREVTEAEAVTVGGQFFAVDAFKAVKPEPKPKRAKGAKA
jgi:hypothetical protein